MQNFLDAYLTEKGEAATATRYDAFCDWIHNDEEFAEDVSSRVFANLELKKALAKEIAKDLVAGRWNRMATRTMDARLRALVKYYFSVAVLNAGDLTEEEMRKAVATYEDRSHLLDYSKAAYLSGWSVIDLSPEPIVRMSPGDELYRGYRFFTVNMLCFTADRFLLGFRCDNGPVRSPMKYYKGCKPLGIRKDKDGAEWNLIGCDRALSDDHLAIFSNQLDGDGTLEICDWLSDDAQRVIFRINW